MRFEYFVTVDIVLLLISDYFCLRFRHIDIQFERDSVAKGPGFSKFFLSRDRCVCHKPFHVSIMKFCVDPSFGFIN